MLRNNRLLLFITMTILILIGLVMIYSASYIWADYKFGDSLKYVKQQAIFIGLAFIILSIVLKLDSSFFYKYSKVFLIGSFILLGLVLIPGVGVVRNGSRSWFGIGSFGIQPSEAMKLALIISCSKFLSIKTKAYKSVRGLLPILILTGFAFLLIMLQPDFGTGFILIMSIIALLFVSGVKNKYFVVLGIALVCGATLLILIAPYRLDRITSFLNPWRDPLGTGFQIIQSLFAIGPGGLLGFGFLESRQKHFYLPEPQTDFIFSIICEEFGIIGAFVIICLFTILIYLIIKMALQEDNLFKKYVIFGLGFQIIFQAILNLSVVIGLIPVTGVTLPFISYGGSSLLITVLSIGIILCLTKKEQIN